MAWDDLSMAQRSEVIAMHLQAGVSDLSEIRASYNSFEGGGFLDKAKDFVDDVKANANTIINNLKVKAGIGDTDSSMRRDIAKFSLTDGNLRLEDVNRMPGRDGLKAILSNEFVERNNNTVRPARDFINTTDTLLGDGKIPLSRISRFYGSEDGKFKVGAPEDFDPETVIIPIRNRDIEDLDLSRDRYQAALQNIREQYESDEAVRDRAIFLNDSLFGTLTDKQKKLRYNPLRMGVDRQLNEGLPKRDPQDYNDLQKSIVLHRESIKRRRSSGKNPFTDKVAEKDILQDLSGVGQYERPAGQVNSSRQAKMGQKFILYDDSQENAYFYRTPGINDSIRSFKEKHGSVHTVLLDNGRYTHYSYNDGRDLGPDAALYSSMDWLRPQKVYGLTLNEED